MVRKQFFIVFLLVAVVLSALAVATAQQSVSFSYTVAGSGSASSYSSPLVIYTYNISAPGIGTLYTSPLVSIVHNISPILAVIYFPSPLVRPILAMESGPSSASLYSVEYIAPNVYGIVGYYDYLWLPLADVFFIYGVAPYISAKLIVPEIVGGAVDVEPRVSVRSCFATSMSGAVPTMSGLLVGCSYISGGECRIYSCNGTVLDEPDDPWIVDLDYRLPIIYMLFKNVSEIVVVIDSPALASWIWGNGTVAVAINDELLTTDLFDVYIVDDRYVEVAIYTAPNSSYGFIYLYYGSGGPSIYTEQVFRKAEIDMETPLVQECLVLQMRAIVVPLPPPPPLLPTETPVSPTTSPVPTTTAPTRVVEVPWWLLLLILLLMVGGAVRRRRE